MGVKLNWLKKPYYKNIGVTWGVPWKRGILKSDENLCLISDKGKSIPLQSWTTAYWPDGSIKWTAHSASINSAEGLILEKGKTILPEYTMEVINKEDNIEINTGRIICIIGKSGAAIIRSINMNGKTICENGKLLCIKEEIKNTEGVRAYRQEDFESFITSAEVEQQGAVRVVVKIEGKHKVTTGPVKWVGEPQWIPFVMRLYFYEGQASVKVMHTFFYDGNEHKDFIKGLGIAFTVPMSGQLYNRHVRLSGDTGFFADSPKGMCTQRSFGNKYEELFRKQQSGEVINFDEAEDSDFLRLLEDSAVWESFKLIQDSSEHSCIQKRTKDGCSWVKAVTGRRSAGFAYVGSAAGGLGLCLRNFWEKSPASIDITGVASDNAVLRLWFWSPEAQAMDLRHYDTETHVASSYEGFDEMRSTPFGIANTSEFKLWCCEETPSLEELKSMELESREPSLLICEPQYYSEVKAFGSWAAEDRSTKFKAWFEEQHDNALEYIKNEISQRKWYGFWDYGDIMRFYDRVRHSWRYDLGGCAWNNSEIVPNMWLWYAFLRSGREDIFRLAESFTRHASEVDQYHFGQYAGLGSRHNVVHWGCGCKEARVSMAGLHRFYYYLTADERMGDILDEVKDADYTILNLDPLRTIVPKDEHPTHARSGPDWAAFVSNWMTRWERYKEEEYKNKIITGIECLKNMPYKLNSGPMFGYDPKNGKLFRIGDLNQSYHMVNCFGALEIWMELSDILQDSEWNKMLADYGEFYMLDLELKKKQIPEITSDKLWGMDYSVLALAAFSAAEKNDYELSKKIWNKLINEEGGIKEILEEAVLQNGLEVPNAITEVANISSGIGMTYLNAFFAFKYLDKWIPEDN